MKFIILFLLIPFAMSFVYAQSSTTTSTAQISTHKLSNWERNLKIRYFGEFAGPNLERWDDNLYDHEGQKTRNPVSLWNLFNFQYAVGNSTSLLVSPRFYTQVGDRNELKENEDQNVVVADDLQLGVIQRMYRNSWMNFDGRLTHRHPISIASKNDRIDSQIEYQNNFFFIPSPAISILFWNTFRYYMYEPEKAKQEERYRINFTTIFNYNFTDKWKAQFFHDLDLQHRNPKQGADHKDLNYTKGYRHSLAFGVGFTPTRAFTIMPFVKALDLNKKRITEGTTQVGFWLFANVFN